jgi:hypothetical protein
VGDGLRHRGDASVVHRGDVVGAEDPAHRKTPL